MLRSGLQVGIEVAVPQHRSDANPRKDPDVCKDVVIWPEPRMTCWDDSGLPSRYPLAVIEWKSLNRRDPSSVRKRKRLVYHEYDLPWLIKTSVASPGFLGYGVFVDLTVIPLSLVCARAFAGAVQHSWLQFGPSNSAS